MSEQTKAALDAAIEAHIADECEGGIVTGYVLQTQYTGMEFLEERMTGYLRMVHETQNFTTTLGLIHYMRNTVESDMHNEASDQ